MSFYLACCLDGECKDWMEMEREMGGEREREGECEEMRVESAPPKERIFSGRGGVVVRRSGKLAGGGRSPLDRLLCVTIPGKDAYTYVHPLCSFEKVM